MPEDGSTAKKKNRRSKVSRSPNRPDWMSELAELDVRELKRIASRFAKRVRDAADAPEDERVRILGALVKMSRPAARFAYNLASFSQARFQETVSCFELTPSAIRAIEPFREDRSLRRTLGTVLRNQEEPQELAGELIDQLFTALKEGSEFLDDLGTIRTRAELGDDVTRDLMLLAAESSTNARLLRVLAASSSALREQTQTWGLSPSKRTQLIRWRNRFGVLETPAHDALELRDGSQNVWTNVRGQGWIKPGSQWPMLDVSIYSKNRERFRMMADYDDVLRLVAAMLERLASFGDEMGAQLTEVVPDAFYDEGIDALKRARDALDRVRVFLEQARL